MSIQYNVSYLIAAIIILIVLGLNYLNQRHMDDMTSRFFMHFYFVGLIDVILDLWSSALLMRQTAPTLTKVLLSLLYLLQILVLYLFFGYSQSLRNISIERKRKLLYSTTVPVFILLVMIIINYQEGFFFYFTSDGVYQKGPLYLIMYVVAIAYVIAAAYTTIVHAKEFGAKRKIVWEFLTLCCVCVIIQAVNGELLLTGLGIALGIMVFCLTISNPRGYMDTLTGVFDKPYFESWIKEKLARNKELYIISVDVYRLKQINKVYGNGIGDKLLIEISERLQFVSGSDHIFRMTGNRFVVVVSSIEEYEYYRKNLNSYFEKPFVMDGELIRCPAIICGIQDAKKLESSHNILDYIEYLVSLAPNNEGTVMVLDNEGTMKGFNYEKEIEKFLNEAIDQDWFDVYYQPIYNIEKKAYTTLEALSRLSHPVLGPVSPDVFITVAERNGLISKIGVLQLKRICRFIKDHEELMTKIDSVKINLSPVELMKPGLPQKLLKIIRDYGVPTSCIQFEITETVATEYTDNIFKVVQQFSQAGIKLSLDDFGSGYANLNTVLQLPFSTVKVDKTLLNGICDNKRAAAFYESIVKIMQEMGFEVVAEGVETKAVLELLTSFGVDMIQGYYFSRPLDETLILQEIKKY